MVPWTLCPIPADYRMYTQTTKTCICFRKWSVSSFTIDFRVPGFVSKENLIRLYKLSFSACSEGRPLQTLMSPTEGAKYMATHIQSNESSKTESRPQSWRKLGNDEKTKMLINCYSVNICQMLWKMETWVAWHANFPFYLHEHIKAGGWPASCFQSWIFSRGIKTKHFSYHVMSWISAKYRLIS